VRPAKRSIAMRARPDGLLAAAPLILRCAPDRRRQSGDVQPGAPPGCRTGLFVCRRFELLVSGLVARVCRIIFLSLSAPGRIARGCAAHPPLRSGPPPPKRRRPTRRAAGLSNRSFCRRRFELLISGLVARVCRIIFLSLSAPGEIRTPDPLVRSSKGQKIWKF